MRCSKVSFIFLLISLLSPSLQAAETRILKVLPHYLDARGRHSLSPSLYERDAYQLHLRQHPEQRSALRFDVQWKGASRADASLKLKIEIRGAKDKSIEQISVEQPVQKKGWFSNWASIRLPDDDFKKIGQVIAWRATLWKGDQQVAEQKSFLW